MVNLFLKAHQFFFAKISKLVEKERIRFIEPTAQSDTQQDAVALVKAKTNLVKAEIELALIKDTEDRKNEFAKRIEDFGAPPFFKLSGYKAIWICANCFAFPPVHLKTPEEIIKHLKFGFAITYTIKDMTTVDNIDKETHELTCNDCLATTIII